MKTFLLTLQMVTWNSAGDLPGLLSTLKSQRYKDYRLTVIDNASTDRSLEIVRGEFPHATIIRNSDNAGFSAAHNQGIQMAKTPFIGLVNPDISFTSEALEVLMEKIASNKTIGSIGGKLLRNGRQCAIIDSAGLVATKFREFLNRGEGEPDQGQYDTPEEVFGITGALVILRAAALESIRTGTEYLDEDLFAYKDDIDLAWRLRLAGWINWYEPRAVFYHRRRAKHEQSLIITARRGRKGTTVNRLSYRNHLLVLAKNDRIRSWFLPYPRVVLYEVAKIAYAVFREPRTLYGLLDALRLLPAMRRKRTILFRRRRVPFRSVLSWFR